MSTSLASVVSMLTAVLSFSYAANKAANKYIFNRSDVVSAIGAFVVGILGNVYSRLCGGTAFQVMSVGVSLLIPVSLLFRYPAIYVILMFIATVGYCCYRWTCTELPRSGRRFLFGRPFHRAPHGASRDWYHGWFVWERPCCLFLRQP